MANISTVSSPTGLRSRGKITTDPPNILVILADDVGIDMLAQYQAYMIANAGFPSPAVSYADTPTLQSMKTAGVRFMNMRTQPNCSPTRACMLSGRYAFRTGISAVVREANMDLTANAWEFGINHATDELFMPRLTIPKGYRCGIFGKWHLAAPDGGTVPNGVPWEGGTPAGYGTGWTHPDTISSTDGQHIDYGLTFSNLDIEPLPADSGSTKPGYHNFYWRSKTEGNDATTTQVADEYHTAYSRQELQSWIQGQTEPWLAYWALCAIHSPFGTFPDNGGGNSGCMPPDDGTTATDWDTYNDTIGTYPVYNSCRAAIEAMDYQIGLLKTALGDEWDRTMVLFIGDNGTQRNVLVAMQDWETANANAIGEPYASLLSEDAFKGTVHEAGLRVPMMVTGPLVASPNRDYLGLVDAVDVYATIRHIARVPYSSTIQDDRVIDGISFLHALQDGTLDVEGSRQFSFSETYIPLGAATGATDTDAGHQRDRSYILHVEGDGVYKLNRELSGTVNVDTFFQLMDDDYVPLDPYMQTPLATGAGVPNYVACAQAMSALFATETESIV